MAAVRTPLVVVLGPTGAGKSRLAIEIAKAFTGEIISADSMQIYKGLDIISNKVTDEEQAEAPHHLISYVEPDRKHYNVVDFRNAALRIIDDLFSRSKMPIIVGGTNYYIESILWDFLINKMSNDQGASNQESKAEQQSDISSTMRTFPTTPLLQEANNDDHENVATVLKKPRLEPCRNGGNSTPSLTEKTRAAVASLCQASSHKTQGGYSETFDVSESGTLHKALNRSTSQSLSFSFPSSISPSPSSSSSSSSSSMPLHLTSSLNPQQSSSHIQPASSSLKQCADFPKHNSNSPTHISHYLSNLGSHAQHIDLPNVTSNGDSQSQAAHSRINRDPSVDPSAPSLDNSPSSNVALQQDEEVSLLETSGDNLVSKSCESSNNSFGVYNVQDSVNSFGLQTTSPSAPTVSSTANLDDHSRPSLLRELASLSASELYSRLQEVDPDTAARQHPNNTRKVLRALQVYYETGRTMSSLLEEQHKGREGAKSGLLRYQDPCILWVKCRQPELDRRLDSRVDTMLEKGLLKELEDFYEKAQSLQLNTIGGPDDKGYVYPHGMLQMLGFKEFKEYLCLSPQLRSSEEGKKLFKQGVEDLKQATRKYAKQQVRWITNRFCARPGPSVPPVYSVDSTDLSTWDQSVAQAIEVVQAFTQGKPPTLTPEPTEKKVDSTVVRQVCDVCGGRVFLHQHEWTGHLQSKKHRHNVKLLREREKLSSILSTREEKLKQGEEEKHSPQQRTYPDGCFNIGEAGHEDSLYAKGVD